MSLPRNEYPRPQFVRKEWINLNGQWSYSFDFSKSGEEKNWQAKKSKNCLCQKDKAA